jgi:hypothetical protein
MGASGSPERLSGAEVRQAQRVMNRARGALSLRDIDAKAAAGKEGFSRYLNADGTSTDVGKKLKLMSGGAYTAVNKKLDKALAAPGGLENAAALFAHLDPDVPKEVKQKLGQPSPLTVQMRSPTIDEIRRAQRVLRAGGMTLGELSKLAALSNVENLEGYVRASGDSTIVGGMAKAMDRMDERGKKAFEDDNPVAVMTNNVNKAIIRSTGRAARCRIGRGPAGAPRGFRSQGQVISGGSRPSSPLGRGLP